MDTGPSGSVFATRVRAIPWALREAARFVRARVRGEPPVHEAALDWVRQHATAGDPVSVLRTLDRFAVERRFLMNVGDEKGPMLDRIVVEKGPAARILELGTFVGYSAILMARHLGPSGRIVSIDTSDRATRVGREMAAFAAVGDRIDFVCGSSGDIIGTLREPFDVVFLDHWKGRYLDDARAILERGLLRPGAVVVADNVGPMFGDNPYVPWMRARTDFASEYVRAHVEYEQIEDGVLVSRWKGPLAAPLQARWS